MKAVILVAGVGSRLGNSLPKCLTPLRPGYTIMDQRLETLATFSGDIIAVVGFRRELIEERHPGLDFAHNPAFDRTNTSQSLLAALPQVGEEDMLLLNGDVVFDPRIVPALLAREGSSMAVVRCPVAEEEVKFSRCAEGRIAAVSKTVAQPEGEAIGINLIRADDLALVRAGLERCEAMDYFERGFEFAIAEGLALDPVDVTSLPCIEVDCIEDLNRAKEMFGS
jgi:choline kinase